MSRANISLDYVNLSKLIEFEINKRDIEIKSYPIKVSNLIFKKADQFLVVSANIISKWNASFQLKAIPLFSQDGNTLQLKEPELKLSSKNILFRGVLNLIKSNILRRIEEMSNAPLTPFIEFVTNMLDEEIQKAELPYHLSAQSATQKLEILDMQFEEDKMLIAAEIKQELNISFANKQESPS